MVGRAAAAEVLLFVFSYDARPASVLQPTGEGGPQLRRLRTSTPFHRCGTNNPPPLRRCGADRHGSRCPSLPPPPRAHPSPRAPLRRKGPRDNDFAGSEVAAPTEGIGRPLAEVLKELGNRVRDSFVKTRVEDNGFAIKYIPCT